MKRLLVVLFVLVMAISCGDSGKSNTPAVDINIETVSAGFIETLKERHKGKVMIVNFFASWCPPCRGETPDFTKAYAKHKDNDFIIIGISLDKKPEDAVKFINEFNVNYPVYHSDSSLGSEMNIGTIPTSIVYKPDGKLFDIVVGPLTAKELDVIAGSFK
ncbi:MAG: hypothetical protein C0602_01415 [Denitrovibrio sp.]|nr:MAG: hypothetical protein C0602_01415 [Denitrovibrio sp.]